MDEAVIANKERRDIQILLQQAEANAEEAEPEANMNEYLANNRIAA